MDFVFLQTTEAFVQKVSCFNSSWLRSNVTGKICKFK